MIYSISLNFDKLDECFTKFEAELLGPTKGNFNIKGHTRLMKSPNLTTSLCLVTIPNHIPGLRIFKKGEVCRPASHTLLDFRTCELEL